MSHAIVTMGAESAYVFDIPYKQDIWLALYYLVFVLSCLFGFLVTWYWA